MLTLKITLKSTMLPSLRKTLEAQLHELQIIETEVYSASTRRGWELNDMDPALMFFKCLSIHLRLYFKRTTSQIAAYMIHANTAATITTLCTLHRAPKTDAHSHFLSQKLLDCEAIYIRRLQNYL